jgi:hypothetical protein
MKNPSMEKNPFKADGGRGSGLKLNWNECGEENWFQNPY